MKNTVIALIPTSVFLFLTMASPGISGVYPKPAISSGSKVRVRSQASTSAEVVGHLEEGQRVEVVGASTFTFASNGKVAPWYLIKDESLADDFGWVFGGFLNIDDGFDHVKDETSAMRIALEHLRDHKIIGPEQIENPAIYKDYFNEQWIISWHIKWAVDDPSARVSIVVNGRTGKAYQADTGAH